MWTMIQLKATSAPIFPVKYTAFRHASRGKPISANCITDDSSMSDATQHNRIFCCKKVSSLSSCFSFSSPLYPHASQRKCYVVWCANGSLTLFCFMPSKYYAVWVDLNLDLSRNDNDYLDNPSPEKQLFNFIWGELVYFQTVSASEIVLKTFTDASPMTEIWREKH